MIDQLIAVSLPFAFALLLQFLKSGVRAYAMRSARMTSEAPFSETAPITVRSVDLAVYVYAHLGYVFSILSSSVACIAFTILSARPALAAVGAACLVGLIPTWLIRWQGLSAAQLASPAARGMSASGWLAVTVQWGVTLYARFYPAPPGL